MSAQGWIGVDLDGTLAVYDHWRGIQHIGDPIPAMVERVKVWRAQGQEVRIFTARISDPTDNVTAVVTYIEAWCLEHLGEVLPITNIKTFSMAELWDDRCVQVERNTGRVLGDTVPGGPLTP